ncbi:phosphocholine cytidylyltransferase family protein [Pelagibius sp. CAU 1746]|uniref:phosphocholine cytidylyltransferase family protein n=1 Tax=Pelagibius sp. CAU 1746 TaxID=3140370 RepID=UPI00325B04A2
MRAVILAAGRGSRMRDLTADNPKCMLALSGRPLLHWQIDALRRGGVTEIGVVTGYKRELVASPELTEFRNARWEETNMVVSLTCAGAWLSEAPCIVSYSDIVYEPRVVSDLAGAEGDVTIAYDRDWLDQWRARFDDPLEDAETFRTDDRGRLTEIGGRAGSLDEIQGQYMGLLRFSPKGWDVFCSLFSGLPLARRETISMTELLSLMIANGSRIDTVPVNGGWFEADDQHDLAVCAEWCRTGKLAL